MCFQYSDPQFIMKVCWVEWKAESHTQIQIYLTDLLCVEHAQVIDRLWLARARGVLIGVNIMDGSKFRISGYTWKVLPHGWFVSGSMEHLLGVLCVLSWTPWCKKGEILVLIDWFPQNMTKDHISTLRILLWISRFTINTCKMLRQSDLIKPHKPSRVGPA